MIIFMIDLNMYVYIESVDRSTHERKTPYSKGITLF